MPGHKLTSAKHDVLDTWFSSALWPHSTLGWPEQTPELKYYYPTSVLITSRDIITLWVARMVLTGLHNVGEVPFREVYIHPKILDGYGEAMSKSKGNGVDPVDVIEKFGADALRFGLAYLTTETQDVRMPVEFECPHCQALIEQTKKNRVLPRIECEKCGKPFSHAMGREAGGQGAAARRGGQRALRAGPQLLQQALERLAVRADESRRLHAGPVADDELLVEDRWILSRLATVTRQVTDALDDYRYADAARVLYDFAWDEFCSFYVEMVKGRLQDADRAADGAAGAGPHARHAAAAAAPDDSVPDRGGVAAAGPRRRRSAGSTEPQPAAESIMIAPWPEADPARQDAADRGPVRPVPGGAARGCARSAAGRTCRRRRRSTFSRPLRRGDGRAAAADGAVLRVDGRRARPRLGARTSPPPRPAPTSRRRAPKSSSTWPS